jgi:hypothetical protein
MNKLALSVAAALALGCSAALAGEISGPPGPDGAEGGATPIAGFWSGDGAASICSFSGLNDDRNADLGGGALEDTQTQSFGTFMNYLSEIFGITKAEARVELGSPGVYCNPSKFGNPKKS